MTKRNIRIRLRTSRLEIPGDLFEDDFNSDGYAPAECDMEQDLPEPTELWMDGMMRFQTDRVELVYRECEFTGMDHTITTIGFDPSNPKLISLIRTGLFHTALVFEEGQRHICHYNTPLSTFEVCAHAIRIENDLLHSGTLLMEYLVEIHGAQAERCRIELSIQNDRNLFEAF